MCRPSWTAASARLNDRHSRKGDNLMNDGVLTALQYYGAAAATLAALLVSLDLGRRWTGYATLIAWGFLQPDSEGIGVQNIVLLMINSVGVWRYLLSPSRNKRAGRSGKPDIARDGKAPAA
jgi:hypothetical protein